jgi:hypothetical protein
MGRKDAELRGGLDTYDTVIVPASDLKTGPAPLGYRRLRAQPHPDVRPLSRPSPAGSRLLEDIEVVSGI